MNTGTQAHRVLKCCKLQLLKLQMNSIFYQSD